MLCGLVWFRASKVQNTAEHTHVAPAGAGVVTRKLRPSCCDAGASSNSVTLPTPARVMFLEIWGVGVGGGVHRERWEGALGMSSPGSSSAAVGGGGLPTHLLCWVSIARG